MKRPRIWRRGQFWVPGNRLELLENGEEYFPRVFAAIARAEREVFVETFILFDDHTGRGLQAAVIAAARRGVRVELTVDGYGSADLPDAFIAAMTGAGVRFHVFDPRPRLLGFRTNLFRRLHRKLVVIDGRLAFVGGINFADDHLRASGPGSKQDWAVQVEGPVVDDIHRLVESFAGPVETRWQRLRRWTRGRRSLAAAAQHARAGEADATLAQAALVVRDNQGHRQDIERHYRAAIRSARRELIIANAYFFPGFRLLRALRGAARRGVDVCLILQGRPDMPFVRWATVTLYDYLLLGGVKIYEYRERPLHGKVAVVDDDWSTVGSSNLDPLSLFLNLEANLIIRSRDFAFILRERLRRLIREHCEQLDAQQARERTLPRQLLSFLAFHLMRWFPSLAGWLPAHTPRHQVIPRPEAE